MINEATALDQRTINEIYATLDEDGESRHGTMTADHLFQKSLGKEGNKRIVNRRTEAPTSTAVGALSSIFEDISKHFSQELILDQRRHEQEGPREAFRASPKRKHRPSRSFDSNAVRSEEGIEVTSTGVISKGFLGLSEVASISTLGNVSRPNGSRGHLHGRPSASRGSEGGSKDATSGCYTNLPHPLLEFPPLYWLFKPFPKALDYIKSLYRFRWHVSYPLQRRVVFSQYLRKHHIQMTWGELILAIPVVFTVVGGILTTFLYPSAELSGHSARLALIFALVTAMRNSLLTLLLGLPFERALWYHKLSGRLAFVNGILHTYAAHRESIENSFLQFLFLDQMNASGTGLMLLIAGVTITSIPQVRHLCFELFYYIHVTFVATMTACAFYHSGILIPILSVVWVFDLVCRKVIMACCKYPRKARIRQVSDTVVELRFPKCNGFDYNAGQHLSVAVPQIDLTFHPFSIASCPRMKYVSVLIRKAGSWTSALHSLAQEQSEVSVLVEGPNGSPNVDIFDPDRYQSILLLSGGIGVTPCQSLLNQFIYEHSKGLRHLKMIRVVWTDRDPVLMKSVDMVRRHSVRPSKPPHMPTIADNESHDLQSLASGSLYWDVDSFATAVGSTLLAHFPPSVQSDKELEQDFPFDLLPNPFRSSLTNAKKKSSADAPSRPGASVSSPGGEESTFRAAFQNPSVRDILDVQVYLSSRANNNEVPAELTSLPFLHIGRPDIPLILADMREEAIAMGLQRVAVILCAPARLAMICQDACIRFSDHELQFDFHMEYQE